MVGLVIVKYSRGVLFRASFCWICDQMIMEPLQILEPISQIALRVKIYVHHVEFATLPLTLTCPSVFPVAL